MTPNTVTGAPGAVVGRLFASLALAVLLYGAAAEAADGEGRGGPATVAPPPTVAPNGARLDLAEIGIGRTSISGQSAIGSRRAKIAFPPDARQSWAPPQPTYVLHLDVLIELAGKSGPGTAIISGVVNGCAGVKINVKVPRGGAESQGAHWESLSALEGTRRGRFKGRRARVAISNYLPTCSVKAGVGSLALEAERYGRIALKEVVFFPDSGIEASHESPPNLKLRPVYPEAWPQVREPFEIGFVLENTGEVAARSVSVELKSLSTRLEIHDRNVHRFDELSSSKEGHFELEGLRVGNYVAELVINSANSNQPLAKIRVPINRAEPQTSRWWVWVAVGLGILISIGLVRRWKRRAGQKSEAPQAAGSSQRFR